jgi:hypothetical protein
MFWSFSSTWASIGANCMSKLTPDSAIVTSTLPIAASVIAAPSRRALIRKARCGPAAAGLSRCR